MDASRTLKVRVGAFVLAVSILLVGIAAYSYRQSLSTTDDYFVTSTFTNVGQLSAGAPVKVGGVNIGKVDDLQLNEALEVESIFQVNRRYHLPADSQAKITSEGIGGDAFLEVLLGDAESSLPQNAKSSRAAQIESVTYYGTAEIMETGNRIGRLFKQIGKNAAGLIKMPELNRDIKELNENVTALQDDAKVLTDEFGGLATPLNSMEWSVNQLGSQSERVSAKLSHAVTEIGGKDGENLTRIGEDISLLLEFVEAEQPRLERIRGDIDTTRTWIDETMEQVGTPNTLIMQLTASSSSCSIPNTLECGKQVFTTMLDKSIFTKIGWLVKSRRISRSFKRSINKNDSAEETLRKWMIYSHNELARYGKLQTPYQE